MPRPGLKSVTLTKDAFDKAREKATKVGKSVARYVTDLIEKAPEVPVS